MYAGCPWLAELANVPQDPHYHAEGDVLTHTRLVVTALAAMAGWQALPPHERATLFVAALLHDIGKATTTIHEPHGRISSPGHARVGAALARRMLWSDTGLGAPLPLIERERIVALVRLHGLPLWFLDRPDQMRAVLLASLRAPLDQVSLLAEADVYGRICIDQGELLARLALFHDYCTEQGCLSGPYPFPSDHSRVRYCRGWQDDPSYHAYDTTWGEVTVLAGLPGVGKDTWLRSNLPDLPQIALDAIRTAQGVAANEPQGQVVQAARAQARELLRRHQPFAWNATNLTRQIRDPLIDMCLSYNARVRIVYLDAPLATVLRRNYQRTATVPAAVIQRLAAKTDVPDWSEAHQVEWVETG